MSTPQSIGESRFHSWLQDANGYSEIMRRVAAVYVKLGSAVAQSLQLTTARITAATDEISRINGLMSEVNNSLSGMAQNGDRDNIDVFKSFDRALVEAKRAAFIAQGVDIEKTPLNIKERTVTTDGVSRTQYFLESTKGHGTTIAGFLQTRASDMGTALQTVQSQATQMSTRLSKLIEAISNSTKQWGDGANVISVNIKGG